jgi:hypothetical protein
VGMAVAPREIRDRPHAQITPLADGRRPPWPSE